MVVGSRLLLIMFWFCSNPAGGDQPAGDGQQPDPGEEHRLRSVRRAHGGLPEMLRHVR